MNNNESPVGIKKAGFGAAPLLGEKRFQVWFVPTEKGKKAFGWQEERLGNYDLMTAEEASFEAYLANLEEPAPDAREYGSYKVREVSPNESSSATAGKAVVERTER